MEKIKNILPNGWEIPSLNADIGQSNLPSFLDGNFNNLHQDSRNVQMGDLFVAITCDRTNDHVRSAIAAGAVAIFVEKNFYQAQESQLPRANYILVDNTRAAFSEMAATLYPDQPERIFAVTGTNGKSSVVTFLRQILGFLNERAVSFGTVGLEFSSDELRQDPSLQKLTLPKLTTPDAFSLHKLLHELKKESVTDFMFEASSHGLDQYRLHQVRVTVAAFTNLTQDHLDYHGTLESYFASKTRLFTEILVPGGVAVLNAASSYTRSLQLLLKQHEVRILTYGVNVTADLEAKNVHLEADHIAFDLYFQGTMKGAYRLRMVGDFQLENVLCATTMAMAEGFSLEKIVPCFEKLVSAKGRMELAGIKDNGARIYVDYAHTPDALERSLDALRSHLTGTSGQLSLVFGCGGNRDVLKRPLMGEIAHKKADRVIITDDNPRDEDPDFIRAQILSHCPTGINISNRNEAISTAIEGLGPQDILLVAGKGHERGQIVKDQILTFDDVDVVRKAIRVISN